MNNFTVNKEEFEIKSERKFNAKVCNAAAHNTIAQQERNLIQMVIENAANGGNFSAIIDRIHPDNREWLEKLGFKTEYDSFGYRISWRDN